MNNLETLTSLDTRNWTKTIKPKTHITLKHIQSSDSLRWDVLGHISTLIPSLLKCLYLYHRVNWNIFHVRGI